MAFTIEFRRSGRGKARNNPDPNYPNGIAIDISQGSSPTCLVDLPYPAPECGAWHIHCQKCTRNAAITAAGRPDDPISVTVPCRDDSKPGIYKEVEGPRELDDDHPRSYIKFENGQPAVHFSERMQIYEQRGKGMIVDKLIHDYRVDADALIEIMRGMQDGPGQQEMALKAHMQRRYADHLESSVRYWLDVREVEKFKSVKIRWKHFPPCVHDQIFVEFNGELKFNFRPWQRADVFVADKEHYPEPTPLRPRGFNPNAETCYRAVHIERNLPPHKFYGWPNDKPVIRATWYEKPMWVRTEYGDHPLLDNFVVSLCESCWPERLDVFKLADSDDAAHPGEKEHARRLLFMTANLMYFLAAENIVRVRIRPEHHERRGRELAGLPKSDKPYYVLPFQLPRYRYLHRDDEKQNGTGDRHVSVCFDVRGHARHLEAERYERNPDGTVRTIWIGGHQRGLGHAYRPTIRKGSISAQMLDYDVFMKQEEARLSHAR